MKKYTFSTIGDFHLNHNEDALIVNKTGHHQLLIAVMDGCSMGKESHFASTVIGKILKKVSKDFHYLAFVEKTEKSLTTLLKESIRILFKNLQEINQLLHLERDELLSTLIIGIVDVETRSAELLTVGDGLIYCDGVLTEYEQDNQPDYLGYHLNENFEEWYDQQSQRLSLTKIQDLSIATDGIFTFRAFDTKTYDPITEAEIMALLLKDQRDAPSEMMLNKRMIEIETNWGLRPTDDLTMIRLIFDS